MKSFLILITFISISIFAVAQQSYQDVVYLKNGSIIRGVIIEQIPNKSIKIETADKSVFVYQIDEIEKMTKEARPYEPGNTASKPNYIIGIGTGKDYLTTAYQEVKEAPPEKAIIYIYRPYKYSGSAVHFLVKANGIPVNNSYLYVRGYMVFFADTGIISFTAFYLGMPGELSVKVVAGQSYYIEGSLGMRPNFKLRDKQDALEKIKKCKLIANYQ
jgi:hypothetical protein